MENNLSGQPATVAAPVASSPVPSVAPIAISDKKPKSPWKIILIIVGLGILLVGGILGYLILQGVKDAPQIKPKVDGFMQNVSSGNLDAAYSLTSEEFKKSTSAEDFAKAMNVFRAQFSGFKSQDQTGFKVEANTGKPTQFIYSGVITYDDGDKGEVNAILVKEANEWKILYIKVNVGIDRLEKFQQKAEDSVLGTNTAK